MLNQAPHRQQYFPASLPPLPLTTAAGQGMLGLGGGHALGSVGTGVDGEQSEAGLQRRRERGGREYGIIFTTIQMQMNVARVCTAAGDCVKTSR